MMWRVRPGKEATTAIPAPFWSQAKVALAMSKERLVIVGKGLSQDHMSEHLSETVPDRFYMTIFDAAPCVDCDRGMLSAVLSGEKPNEYVIIHADVVVMAVGIRPNTRIVLDTGTAQGADKDPPQSFQPSWMATPSCLSSNLPSHNAGLTICHM